MIVTATRNVNARLNNPYTSSVNPRFLVPGEKVNIKARVFGETIEGSNEWLLTDQNEFFTLRGFNVPTELSDIPFDNVPLLFKQLEISKLWSLSKGEKLKIGIIDVTGVGKHKAILQKITALNYSLNDTPTDSHATCMASVIAGYNPENNEIGIAPLVDQIYAYKIDDESIPPDKLKQALIELQKRNVDIINMSIASTIHSKEDYDMLKGIIDELVDSNVLLVSSTGEPAINRISFPAALDKIISVSGYVMPVPISYDATSNIWNTVNISAPYNKYFDKSFSNIGGGTSYSCAIISGIFACAYSLLLNKSTNTTVYKYIIQNILPQFDKLSYVQNNIAIPAYDTIKLINLLK